MSTFTNKQLGIGALSATLTTTLYTASAVRAIVTAITLSNTNTTTVRNVTIKFGPGTKRTLLSAYPMQPGETLIPNPNFVLEASDVIQGGQDTGTDVEYSISGVEVA